MKVLIISHSNVHPRQQYFAEALSKFADVLCIMPKSWGELKGFDKTDGRLEFRSVGVSDEGNIYHYRWDRIDEIFYDFHPDVVYCVAEPGSSAVGQVLGVSPHRGWYTVLFTWENIHKPTILGGQHLNSADLVVCGNQEAQKLAGPFTHKTAVLPQAGVNTELFKPISIIAKVDDVVSVGRPVREKGGELILQAFPGAKFVHGMSYVVLPFLLNQARVHVSFPFSTMTWKEQSMGYVTAEAMSCGLPVITTDCGAIPEYLSDSWAHILPMKDVGALQSNIHDLLVKPHVAIDEGAMNRKFIVENLSNEVIAKKLFELFEEVLS